ncbi:MAG: peptide chain release factor 1 [Eubacteriales bacterium]|nr:peptide chain release factor 1 [Eubacteriales bacterium]
MIKKLEDLKLHYDEIINELSSDIISNDKNKYKELIKEQNFLEPIISKYEKLLQYEKTEKEAIEILSHEKDLEMISLWKAELDDAKSKQILLDKEIKMMLIPKDENDDKNIIVEIRQGAGGDEAALFATELYKMYNSYASSMNWKVELISLNENGIGGYKEVIFTINGKGAYSKLKYESGVHRVQRVPVTESGGRIHTSTVTVAVLPEAEEWDVKINIEDCRFDVFRASGHGGQCVNTTDSAVRLTHIPSGIVVSCQDGKSQLKNKEQAMKVLRARLYEKEYNEHHEKEKNNKRSLIGTGDRSEKIRTYNFPQGRVTDHRINLTLYKIINIMNGDINELIETIIAEDNARKLSKNDI